MYVNLTYSTSKSLSCVSYERIRREEVLWLKWKIRELKKCGFHWGNLVGMWVRWLVGGWILIKIYDSYNEHFLDARAKANVGEARKRVCKSSFEFRNILILWRSKNISKSGTFSLFLWQHYLLSLHRYTKEDKFLVLDCLFIEND